MVRAVTKLVVGGIQHIELKGRHGKDEGIIERLGSAAQRILGKTEGPDYEEHQAQAYEALHAASERQGRREGAR